MIFRDAIIESANLETDAAEKAENNLLGVRSEDPDDVESVANDINAALAVEACNSASFFDGGSEAVNKYIRHLNEGQVQNVSEAIISSIASRNTIMRLNARDEMKRRVRLGCIIIARNNKDPLFKRLSVLKAKEKAIKRQIYAKYSKKAYVAARLSVRKHNMEVKKDDKAPKFVKDATGNKTSFALINTPEVR